MGEGVWVRTKHARVCMCMGMGVSEGVWVGGCGYVVGKWLSGCGCEQVGVREVWVWERLCGCG